MIRGLYTAASGMITEQRKHDAITNNIANINTPGFKANMPATRSFPEVLISLMNGQNQQPQKAIGRMHTGVMVEEMVPIFMQGDLLETGTAGDMAIVSNVRVFEEVNGVQTELVFDDSGKAVNADGETVYQPQVFFTLLNQAGELRYTRDGQFETDEEGFLRSADGSQVLGINGEPIQLGQSMERMIVDKDGRFFDARNGQAILDENDEQIRLQLSQINNPFQLIREGNGNFRLDDAENNPPVLLAETADVNIYQRHLERSNVDAAKSMVELNTVLKAYEANQKVIQYYDRSLEKAVNEIGRV